jgi:hypothetical protein
VRCGARLRAALLLGLAGFAPSPLRAGDGTGLVLSLGGGLAAGAVDWSAQSTFPLYAEPASLSASYHTGSGPALEGALGFRFSRHLGVVAAVGWSRRTATAQVEASLPHPLYLDRPRSLEAQVDGLEHSELALHLDLEWRTSGRRLEAALFAGPTLVRVKTSLVESVTGNEAYPYDEVTFREARTVEARDAGFGWNIGASLGLALGTRFTAGVAARYARGGVELAPAGSQAFRIDAGGPHVVGFVRLRF